MRMCALLTILALTGCATGRNCDDCCDYGCTSHSYHAAPGPCGPYADPVPADDGELAPVPVPDGEDPEDLPMGSPPMSDAPMTTSAPAAPSDAVPAPPADSAAVKLPNPMKGKAKVKKMK